MAERRFAEFNGDWTKMRCSGCVRYTEDQRIPGKYYCCGRGIRDGELTVFTTACEHYWDRKEQDELDRAWHEAIQAERERMWQENESIPPVPAVWTRDWDDGRGELTAEYPVCPDCGNPLFFLEDGRCECCGRKIAMDAKLEQYYRPEPDPIKIMNCFNCGGVNTLEYIVSRYNGHKHGHCTKCGMSFME